MQTPVQSASLLAPIGYRNNSCGYCGNKSGSFSYYAASNSLTAEFYLSLIDHGWRRSGTILYKPDQLTSCCAQYTIRLDSEDFHASKDQRQVQNRLNKFILGDSYIKEAARRFPLSREAAKRRNTDFNLVERVHESEKINLRSELEPAHELKITIESDAFTEEKYALFENYQRIVHHEPPSRISKSGFTNFLCKSPIASTNGRYNGRERRLGSYHQCYRIDEKLVAVGVLDLLPKSVSAVYFMYHESVHQHGFGKLGALREIALAKEDGYEFWYAGFYIHSCAKMRYKGDFSPQQILDPESYEWHLLNDEMKAKLGGPKYVSLSSKSFNDGPCIGLPSIAQVEGTISRDSTFSSDGADSNSDDEDAPIPNPELPVFSRSIPGILTREQLLTEVDLDQIKLQVRGTNAVTSDLMSWDPSDIDSKDSITGVIAELAASVGPDIAREMVVSFG